MEKYLKTSFDVHEDQQEVVMVRLFDAPRKMVFKILTDPIYIPQWWGPRRLTTVVDRMDVKPGGTWRFIQQDAGGNNFAFHGEYREVVPPERLVYTFEYEGMPGHEIIETVTLEEDNGKTLVTTLDRFESVDDLRGMVQSGMESGAVESMERFAELLQKI